MRTISSKTVARVLAFAAIAIVLALLAAGCGPSSKSSDVQAGKAHASAIASDPQVTAAENLLLANYQKEIKATPAHPIAAAQRALHDTFPTGDTAKIEQFAVSKFTVTMVHSHAARAAWAHEVATYALAQGGSTAAPGTAIVPGTTPQATTPAVSHT